MGHSIPHTSVGLQIDKKSLKTGLQIDKITLKTGLQIDKQQVEGHVRRSLR